jgi:hypothetical protein
MRRVFYRLVAVAATLPLLLQPWPAAAQLYGTPGTGPLTPDGPRRGLGPPSLSDNVPDIRLHAPGGGIPGAGPPIDYGSGSAGRVPFLGGPVGLGEDPVQRAGRHCRTPQRICILATAAPVGSGCSCRLPQRPRARGQVVP